MARAEMLGLDDDGHVSWHPDDFEDRGLPVVCEHGWPGAGESLRSPNLQGGLARRIELSGLPVEKTAV